MARTSTRGVRKSAKGKAPKRVKNKTKKRKLARQKKGPGKGK